MKTNILLLILFSFTIYSAPLKNIPVSLNQPDGTIIHCFASGDEFHNWYHDSNNYTIIQNPESGYYVYAVEKGEDLVASDFVVNKIDPMDLNIPPGLNISVKTVEKKRRDINFTESQSNHIYSPKTGEQNNIVIFIRFKGEAEFDEPLSKYANMFNSKETNTNSLYNYFYEASYQKLKVTSHFFPTSSGTVISYEDTYTRGYHQPYNAVTNPTGYKTFDEGFGRELVMVRAAILAIKNQVPADLDVDGDNDGGIDNIIFILKGDPGAWGELIWPHMTGYTDNIQINGAGPVVYNVQCQSSLGTGVLAHEMFHSVGAPDLYHYTDNGIYPTAMWDLMDGTNWNQPQHMGAYMKYKYGTWISSIPEITSDGTYTLNPLTSSTNNVYKIKSPNSQHEFYVLEYRKNTGAFESLLPGSGLLIYRINDLETGNADGPPDEVYLYRPDGTLTINGDFASAYYNSDVGRTRINNNTNPIPFLSDGSAGGLNVSGIGTAGNTISFKVNFNGANKDLSLISPNGNEEWVVGATETINWTSADVGIIKLEYSTNNGSAWMHIADVNAGSGGYNWTIPNTISNQCKVRISDASESDISDISESNFSIVSSSNKISVKFLVDMSYYINESKFNPSTDLVILRGSFNNWGQDDYLFDFNNSKIYSKTISLEKNSYYEYKYFITSAGASNGGWESNVGASGSGNRELLTGETNSETPIALFDNHGKILQLLSPNGGETTQAGTSFNIKWNCVGLNNVRLEYTTDNGSTWNLILSSVNASNQNYNWLVPNVSSDQCKIRISDIENSGFTDESQTLFSIENSYLKLTSPIGGELWMEGSEHNISWIYMNIDAIQLEYSSDGGLSWNIIVQSYPAASLNYEWTVPNSSSEFCLMKISSTAYPEISNTGEGAFTIYPATQILGFGPYYADENTIALFHFDGDLNNKSDYSADGIWNGSEDTYVSDNPLNNGKSIQLNSNASITVPHSANLNLTGDWTIEAWVKFNSFSNADMYIFQKPGDNDSYFSNYALEVNPYWGNVFYGFYFSGTNERLGLVTAGPELNKWYHIAFIRDTQKKSLMLMVRDANKKLITSQNFQYSEMSVLTNSKDLIIGLGIDAMLDEVRISNIVREHRSIKLTSPNGGEALTGGSQFSINWECADIQAIVLEYSSDNGSTWNSIADNVIAESGSYIWNVPNLNSSSCLFRIAEKSDLSFFDLCDNTFTISPSNVFALIQPDGGENWKVGSNQLITWSGTGNYQIKIEYSNDNGNVWSTVAENIGVSTGNYNWKVPYVSSKQCLVKITNQTDQTKTDLSAAAFSIYADESDIINKFVARAHTLNNTTIPYRIFVPENYNSNTKYPLVLALHGAGEVGSDNLIHIQGHRLATSWADPKNQMEHPCFVIAPQCPAGKNWVKSFAGNVEVNSITAELATVYDIVNTLIQQYSIDESRLYITGLSMGGFGTWDLIMRYPDKFAAAIPMSAGASPSNVPRLISLPIWNFHGAVDNVISVSYSRSVMNAFESNGRSVLYTHCNKTNCNGLTDSQIKAELDKGADLIYTEYQNGDHVIWAESYDYKYLIPWVFNQSKSNQSKSILLTKPNGGENWRYGTLQKITWVTNEIAKIRLEFSKDNGVNWILIADNIDASLKSYDWNIPADYSDHCKIKISDVSDPSLFDVSNNVFTISELSVITLLSPNGGELWHVDSRHEITWSCENVAEVNIKYTTTNSASWTNLGNVDAAPGKYLWTIPNAVSDQCKVIISNTADYSVSDRSDNLFTILPPPSVNIVYPNGGELLKSGEIEQITWGCRFIDNVKIEYRTSENNDWITIIDSYPADSGKYNWTVPADPSATCMLKISDISNSGIFDLCDNNFTIEISSAIEDWGNGVPKEYELYQNYPNPFNPSSTIKYQIVKPGHVNLTVYNVLGNKVAVLVNEEKPAGYFEVKFIADNLSSGTYFYRLTSGNFTSVRKMSVIK